MKGIVSSARRSLSGEDIYTIIGEGKVFISRSDKHLELYDSVEFTEDPQGDSKNPSIIVESRSPGSHAACFEAIGKMLSGSLSNSLLALGISQFDSIAEKMKGQMFAAAERIARSVESGSPIVLRFHNDGDGSSGAIAFYNAISSMQENFIGKLVSVSYRINKSISYAQSSLWSDKLFFNTFESVEKPLVIIIDFGTSEQSYEAIDSIKDIDLVWIDHHPLPKDFPLSKIPIYISPWLSGGDSNQTAGALACVLASMLTKMPEAKLKYLAELSRISLISDHSEFAPKSQIESEKALVLDHITSKKLRFSDSSEPSLTPKSMDEVLKDELKWKEMFRKAREQLDEAIRVGIKHAKHYKSTLGFKIVELDFGHVSALDYSILPGRYSSKLHDEMHDLLKEDVVLVVHYANNISIRLDKKISKSINLLEVIERMKEREPFVLNGGGHMEAASIKVENGYIEKALDILFEELGADRSPN
ncbi:MAG: DHH family phosphoesterase [Candidatus Micrarchaeia archaeon]